VIKGNHDLLPLLSPWRTNGLYIYPSGFVLSRMKAESGVKWGTENNAHPSEKVKQRFQEIKQKYFQ